MNVSVREEKREKERERERERDIETERKGTVMNVSVREAKREKEREREKQRSSVYRRTHRPLKVIHGETSTSFGFQVKGVFGSVCTANQRSIDCIVFGRVCIVNQKIQDNSPPNCF